MKLSEHFTLEEMTASETAARKGIDNSPSLKTIDNLKRLATHLEAIREEIGLPIIITSGYRSPALNAAVGGSAGSQHCFGCAADIRVDGMTPDELIEAIIDGGMLYDQLISEFGSWVHYSIPRSPDGLWRRQELIIDRAGVRPYPARGKRNE